MQTSLEKAILKTLVYASIFDCPLTLDEIHRYLIGNKKISKNVVRAALQKLSTQVFFHEGFYTLSKTRLLIQQRIKRKYISNKKYLHAKNVGKLLSFISLVQFIGISGTVAALNAKEDDDIDFFVITKKNTLWLTRLFLVILLQVLGARRRRLQKNVADTICLNMFVDGQNLLLPKDRHDIYTAHEIVQMLPVFDRDNTYNRFLHANKWVRKYLANSIDNRIIGYYNITEKKKSPSIFEFLAKHLQLWYMQSHRTNETVTEALVAFHPIDHKKRILALYTKKLKQYGII